MLSNSKLYTRILLGYLVPCIVFSVVTGVIYVKAMEVRQAAQDFHEIVSVVEEAIDLRSNMAEMQRATRGALLKPEDLTLMKQDHEAALSESNKFIRDLKGKTRDQELVAALGEMEQLSGIIANVTRAQIELVQAGRVADSIKEFRTAKSEELYKAFWKNGESYLMRAKQIELQHLERLNTSVEAVITISLVGVLCAVALSLYLGNLLARRTSNELKQAISAIAASSAQIASTTAQHESATAQQSSAVTETTSALEEVVATARVNAEQAESATSSALKVQETTRGGLDLVTHNEQDMVSMEATMSKIAEQIIKLSEQAGRIGEIAHAVGELAAETNMLALNAAVEAARSGEQGRGFGVVAGEIRKLADQSKKSAERANQIVGEIQKSTNSMVMTAEDAGKITHAAAESARQASIAFDSIIHLADSVVHSAQSVLQNSKQQAVALSQVDVAMKSINSGSGEIASGTIQIREGMTRLTHVAGDLDRLI